MGRLHAPRAHHVPILLSGLIDSRPRRDGTRVTTPDVSERSSSNGIPIFESERAPRGPLLGGPHRRLMPVAGQRQMQMVLERLARSRLQERSTRESAMERRRCLHVHEGGDVQIHVG